MQSGNVASFAAAWFGLGLATGLAVLVLASRGSLRSIATLNPWVLRGCMAAIVSVSIAVLLARPGAMHAPAAQSTSHGSTASGPAGSIESATDVLATRLAASGGTDEEWNLLAQSYDFLGRTDQAELARQHRLSAQRSLRDAVMATALLHPVSMPRLESRTAAPNARTASLLTQAAEHRRKREFKQASAVYRTVIAEGGMTADAWADFADALASTTPNGSLVGEPADAIARALALDPKHTKALWLQASLAYEEHRYDAALATWRTLLVLMPAGSSDARIIEANIAEAQRLVATAG